MTSPELEIPYPKHCNELPHTTHVPHCHLQKMGTSHTHLGFGAPAITTHMMSMEIMCSLDFGEARNVPTQETCPQRHRQILHLHPRPCPTPSQAGFTHSNRPLDIEPNFYLHTDSTSRPFNISFNPISSRSDVLSSWLINQVSPILRR
jgi:hypothetical protein